MDFCWILPLSTLGTERVNDLNAHSVVCFLGILGYKIHFDSNGDAEFNLTLLDMQLVGMQVFFQFFVTRKA